MNHHKFRADWVLEGGSVARLQDDDDPFRLVHCARCGAFKNLPSEWEFHVFVALHSDNTCGPWGVLGRE